jgi:ATP-binding cassette subfamily B protein
MLARQGDRSHDGDPGAGDRLLLAVARGARGWLALLVALGLLSAGATLALPAALGRCVDQVMAAARETGPWSSVRGSVALTAGLIALAVVADASAQLVSGVGTAGSTGALRRRLARHVLAAGPALSWRTADGDLVARLVGGTATTARVVTVVSGAAGAVIPPVGGVIALAVIDPWLALTFGAGMITATSAVRTYLRDAGAANTGYLQAQASIAARLTDALAGARTIGAARTTGREVERTLAPLAALREHGDLAWRTMARLAFHGEPAVLLTQVAVVAVAGVGLAHGRLGSGEMLAASRYAVMAAGIGGMIGQLSGLTRARAGAQRVADVLDQPVAAYGDRTLAAGPGRLELRGVSAGPPDAPVLDGLHLTIPGGSVVALVGRSGAGKSLVAALAGRLCDPTVGQVRLDGVPLDHLERASLRRSVAFAFERPALLGGTVAGAIGFGVDPPPPERIRRAARAARAEGFIGRLPGGYEAPLAATPMSGGELQRIGLARAMARGARVLVLDDATSSLDTATEAEIAEALTSHAGRCTRLIVTHRATTAARADLVAWLDRGRLRAIGPHRRLWADPEYREMFRPEPAVARPAADEVAIAGPPT